MQYIFTEDELCDMIDDVAREYCWEEEGTSSSGKLSKDLAMYYFRKWLERKNNKEQEDKQ